MEMHMDMSEYQTRAARTARFPGGLNRLEFLVLGLNAKIGEVSNLTKKKVRNRCDPLLVRAEIAMTLGDLLWYLSATSEEIGVPLEQIADENLKCIERRWLPSDDDLRVNEGLWDPQERFPKRLVLQFDRIEEAGLIKLRVRRMDGTQVGDIVDDNEYIEDAYRFHDVIHLALVTHLGWSPVFRKLLGIKRKSNPDVDRVEDGAKARDIEESLCRLIFVYLQDNDFLLNASTVETSFLRQIRAYCRGREIHNVPERRWELLMLNSASVIRLLMQYKSGLVIVDNERRCLEFTQQLDLSLPILEIND
jgi:NTP pyrophosphatase (non-canonical NTP hydrolase)